MQCGLAARHAFRFQHLRAPTHIPITNSRLYVWQTSFRASRFSSQALPSSSLARYSRAFRGRRKWPSLLIIAVLATAPFQASWLSTIQAEEPSPAESDVTPAQQEHIDEQHEEERSHTFWGRIIHFLRSYIAEPFATTRRFLFLAILFLPVLATMPLLLLDVNSSHGSKERRTTLWWYGFLVKQMERAGPTFIKVRRMLLLPIRLIRMFCTASAMGWFETRLIP